MQPVESSFIKSVGYDPSQQVMEVDFADGTKHRYHGVPAYEHKLLMEMPLGGSFGQHFHRFIRGGPFRHEKVMNVTG